MIVSGTPGAVNLITVCVRLLTSPARMSIARNDNNPAKMSGYPVPVNNGRNQALPFRKASYCPPNRYVASLRVALLLKASKRVSARFKLFRPVVVASGARRGQRLI